MSDNSKSEDLSDHKELIEEKKNSGKKAKDKFQNVVMQSQREENIANNELILVSLVHILVVVLTMTIIIFKINLSVIYKDENYDQQKLCFSLFDFTYKNGTVPHLFHYGCINWGNGTVCGYQEQNEECALLPKVIDEYGYRISCYDIIFMQWVGIIVK
jgi:hypothetical protein